MKRKELIAFINFDIMAKRNSYTTSEKLIVF